MHTLRPQTRPLWSSPACAGLPGPGPVRARRPFPADLPSPSTAHARGTGVRPGVGATVGRFSVVPFYRFRQEHSEKMVFLVGAIEPSKSDMLCIYLLTFR